MTNSEKAKFVHQSLRAGIPITSDPRLPERHGWQMKHCPCKAILFRGLIHCIACHINFEPMAAHKCASNIE